MKVNKELTYSFLHFMVIRLTRCLRYFEIICTPYVQTPKNWLSAINISCNNNKEPMTIVAQLYSSLPRRYPFSRSQKIEPALIIGTLISGWRVNWSGYARLKHSQNQGQNFSNKIPQFIMLEGGIGQPPVGQFIEWSTENPALAATRAVTYLVAVRVHYVLL